MDACKNQCSLFAFSTLFAANLNPKVVQQHTSDVMGDITDFL